MVVGLNTDVRHDGRVYHVQTEERGRARPIIESLVYCGGEIVACRKTSYYDLVDGATGYSEIEVTRRLHEQHQELVDEIRRGELLILDAPPAKPQPHAISAPALDAPPVAATPSPAPQTRFIRPAPTAAAADRVGTVVRRDAPAAPAGAPGFAAGASPGSAAPGVASRPRPAAAVRPTAAAEARPAPAVPAKKPARQATPSAVIPSATDTSAPLPRDAAEVGTRRTSKIPMLAALALLPAAAAIVWVTTLRDRGPGGTALEANAASRAVVPPPLVRSDAEFSWSDLQAPTAEPASDDGSSGSATANDGRSPTPRVAQPSAASPPATASPLGADAPRPSTRSATPQARPGTTRSQRVEPPSTRSSPSRSRAVPQPDPSTRSTPSARAEPAPGAPRPEPSPTPLASPPSSTPRPTDERPEPSPAPVATGPSSLQRPTNRGSVPRETTPVAREGIAPPGPPATQPRDPQRPVEPPQAQTEPLWTGMIVDYDAVDEVPRPTRRDLPKYTPRARKRRQQGSVELNLQIDGRGLVREVVLVGGIPGSDLNAQAIEAARGWTFTPARKNGYAVSVWKKVIVDFSLEKGRVGSTRVRD